MESPFKLVKPSLLIGESPNQIELNCAGRKVALVPVDNTDSATFCDPDGSGWELRLDVLQSFGAEGLWNQLHPLKNTDVAFEFLPKDGEAVSASNVQVTGTFRIPRIPFIEAGIKEFHPYTITFEIEDEPTFVLA